MSQRRLGIERVDLWQLHRIDPKVPRQEQFELIREMQQEGLIRHAGLSEVSVEEIEAASKVVTLQKNRYKLIDRGSEAVLDHCTANGIGFIPRIPLCGRRLGAARLDARHDRPQEVAHLEDSVAGAAARLSDAEFKALDEQARAGWTGCHAEGMRGLSPSLPAPRASRPRAP